MEEVIYLRMRHKVIVPLDHTLLLGDIAQISDNTPLKSLVANIPIYKITKKDRSAVVIDVMLVINKIQSTNHTLDIQTIGPSQTIVEVLYKKRKWNMPLFIGIWFLLFIGSGLAIMNFHEDVGMQQVHQKIYYLLTGKVNKYPLMMQIPYSIGIGAGMIIFFNHLFKKRFNEEPSPLEIEVFNYQQSIDQFIALNENDETIKKIKDD